MIDTLIFTLTAECNLACTYCQNEPALKNQATKHLSVRLYEKVLISAANYLSLYPLKQLTFCHSGGEPLTVGLPFWEEIVQKQNEIVPGRIRNVVQSNGTLLDQSWIDFFLKNEISVSISVDGQKQLHDSQRVFKNGEGSFSKLARNLELMHNNGLRYGILTVVSKLNYKHSSDMFDYFVSLPTSMISFIPCTDSDLAVDSDEYSEFMIGMYNKWIENNDPRVGIRELLHIVNSFLGKSHRIGCQFSGECPRHINIGPDGDVFVCDQFINKKTGWLGNIYQNSLAEIDHGELALKFRTYSATLSKKCQNCQFVEVCRGGCAYRRQLDNVDYLCKGRFTLFEYIAKDIEERFKTIVSKT